MKAAELIANHDKAHDVHSGSTLREFILGCQDGVVNVAGIVLGVAVGTQSAPIAVLAGLAAAVAESISMAAVAYTTSKAAKDFYQKQFELESAEIDGIPDIEREEIRVIYRKKGFSGPLLEQITEKITSNREVWVSTMMHEELKLLPELHPPWQQGLIVGGSSFLGSLVPLIPFFLVPLLSVPTAMVLSVLLVGIVLLGLGLWKGHIVKRSLWQSGFEIVFIGLLAAFAGFLVGVFLGAP